MALKNRSQLPDALFFALSEQGQRVANRAGQPAPAPKAPRPLSAAQVQALSLLHRNDPWGYDFSDLRAVEVLVERGLADHTGLGSRAFTGRFVITDAGREQARTLFADPSAPGTVTSPKRRPPGA